MRLISTLCLMLFSSVCFSQIYEMIRKSEFENGKFSTTPKEIKLQICRGTGMILSGPADLSAIQKKVVLNDTMPLKFMIRCGRTQTPDNPLIVVDGVPLEEKKLLSEINPDDIESIDILKNPVSSSIFCRRAAKGVIIIITKSSRLRKFIIKGFLDGERINGATVSFISANKRDTIMLAANDSGVVVTDKLKSSTNYQMAVSAIGYKSLSQNWKNDYAIKEHELMLEREIKTCDEVVVRNGPVFICKRYYSFTKVSNCYMNEIKSDTLYKFGAVPLKAQLVSQNIFPNPALRGTTITIDATTQSDGQIDVRVTSLDGKLLLSQPQKTFKGQNRFKLGTDSRWCAGIYFIQLCANGKLLASDKVIIQ